MYKALSRSISLLSDTDHTHNDWIIALTDGEDNSSQEITAESVMNEFGRTDIGLIIIGVGGDIQPDVSLPSKSFIYSLNICLIVSDFEKHCRNYSQFSRPLCLCRR